MLPKNGKISIERKGRLKITNRIKTLFLSDRVNNIRKMNKEKTNKTKAIK